MKKSTFTLIVCAALVVGGFFGAKAIINREKTAQAEGSQPKNVQTEAPQTQQPEKNEIIWYHPSDENMQIDWVNFTEADQDDALGADEALNRAVENDLPEGMHYPDWFGGRWIGKDNKLHIAFARCADDAARELVKNVLFGHEGAVFYEEDMPYSYNELHRAMYEVYDHLFEKGFKVAGIGVKASSNCILIDVLAEDLEAVEAYRAELEALFPYPMVFEEGEYFQAQ